MFANFFILSKRSCFTGASTVRWARSTEDGSLRSFFMIANVNVSFERRTSQKGTTFEVAVLRSSIPLDLSAFSNLLNDYDFEEDSIVVFDTATVSKLKFLALAQEVLKEGGDK